MVAQIHHLKPRHKAPPQIPTKKPHHKSPPKIIIHDPTIIAYLRHAIVWGGYSLPHTAGTYGTACVGLTIIACLRHAARSTRHLTAPLLATATNSRPTPHCPSTLDSRPLTLAPRLSYLVPRTSSLLPLTPTEHKKGRHPVAPPHILTSIANLRYFTITFAAVPAVRTM